MSKKSSSSSKSTATKTSYRSAVSGRYVTKEFAKSHPKTTVKETDKA